MKFGSKYYPLFEYFQKQDTQPTPTFQEQSRSIVLNTDAKQATVPVICLSFSEIESILQNPLPTSAYKRAWWSNRDTTSALQASAWVKAGYHVKNVDFDQQVVTFCKFQADYTVQRAANAIVWNQNAVKALRKHMGITQAMFAATMGVRRQTVSEWENGVYEPDRSTAKHLALIAKQQSFQV